MRSQVRLRTYSLRNPRIDNSYTSSRNTYICCISSVPTFSSESLRAQGIEFGAALLQDAVNRAVTVAQNAGVRALLVHALHDRARQFYEHYGFQASPQHPMTLLLRLSTVKV